MLDSATLYARPEDLYSRFKGSAEENTRDSAGCWGEDSDQLRLNVYANRLRLGHNPASRFL